MPRWRRDLGGHPADPADVGLAVGLGEGQARAEVPAYDVAVEAGHGPPAVLEDQVVQRLGQRRLAAAGQAGEEDHEAARVVVGLVLVDDRGDLVGPLPVTGQSQHLAGRVVGHHLLPQLVVGVRVAVRGEGDRDDVGRPAQELRGRQGRADEADGGDVLGGAGAVEGEEYDVAPGRLLGDQAEVVVGEGGGDRDGERPGVLLADLGRRELQATEGAVGGAWRGR